MQRDRCKIITKLKMWASDDNYIPKTLRNEQTDRYTAHRLTVGRYMQRIEPKSTIKTLKSKLTLKHLPPLNIGLNL